MVSLVSSVAVVMRLPISWTSSVAGWPHVPAVSTDRNMSRERCVRQAALRIWLSCWPMLCWQLLLLPRLYGLYATWHRCPRGLLHPMPLVCLVPTVAVWSHLVVCHPCNKLVGSFTAGMGSFNCPAEDVVHVMMTLVSGPLLRQDKPCRPRTSTAFPHKQECGS